MSPYIWALPYVKLSSATVKYIYGTPLKWPPCLSPIEQLLAQVRFQLSNHVGKLGTIVKGDTSAM